MSILAKAVQGRRIVEVTPESAGWQYVGFAAYRLAAAERLELPLSAREQCIVVLRGIVSVESGADDWREIGARDSVFEERSPYAVYLPGGRAARITAHKDAEVAVASAPDAERAHPARLIEPSSMKRSTRGEGANRRYICDILPQTEAAASLLVVEVTTPSGHSSSYPPHKHDRDALPEESFLEETYYHRLNPPQGFAFQRVYTDDRAIDESVAVEDHDVVMVSRGYHPVVMPHGYDGYYLNVMAGPRREWVFRNDPVHEWIIKR